MSDQQATQAATGTKTIQVYFNVLQSGNTAAGGAITQTQINNQIQVLNNDYGASGFKFVLGKLEHNSLDFSFSGDRVERT